MVHARPPVVLLASCQSGVLRVEVHDGDRGSVPVLRRTHDEIIEGARPGGRGLLLVDSLSSRWGSAASETGKLVWFELDARR